MASDLNKAVPTFAAWQRPYPKYKRDRHKSYLYIDELGIAAGGAMQPWAEKNTYAFEVLKAMVEHTSILNAVIVTRIRQIQPFLRPHQRHAEHPMGFEIRPKRKGLSDKLTEDEKKVSDDIQCFLLNCGDEQDPRRRDWVCRRSNLSTFMAKSIRDTLTMDACPIETEMTRNGKQLSGLYAIPGETIRLAHEEGYSGDDEIIAVQIYEDQLVTYYEPSELIHPIRNPRTDILASRYGYAETEQFVRIVTGFLNALNYNMAGFDRNNIPRGFLTMFGNFDQNQLNDFKRRWTSLLNGASRRWAFPVMASREKDAGATWTPIDVNVDEMHFAKWMSFLVSIICAIHFHRSRGDQLRLLHFAPVDAAGRRGHLREAGRLEGQGAGTPDRLVRGPVQRVRDPARPCGLRAALRGASFRRRGMAAEHEGKDEHLQRDAKASRGG